MERSARTWRPSLQEGSAIAFETIEGRFVYKLFTRMPNLVYKLHNSGSVYMLEFVTYSGSVYMLYAICSCMLSL